MGKILLTFWQTIIKSLNEHHQKIKIKTETEYFEKKYQSLNTINDLLQKTTKTLLNKKQQSPPITGSDRSLAISDKKKSCTFRRTFY